MARLPQPGADNGAWGDILNDFLLIEHNANGTLKSSGSLSTKADDTSVVHNSGNETIAGTKTFSSSVVVPVPMLGNQAANKTYVDSAIPDVSTKVSKAGDTMSGALNVPGGAVVPSNWFNVKVYGAKGDGSTDDTAALQATINAVPSTGGTVYIPSGTYNISSALELKNSLVLQGDGINASRIAQTTTSANGLHALNAINVDIRDLRVGGPGSGTGIGIYFERSASNPVDYINLTNVNIRQFGSHGFQIDTVIVSTLVKVISQNNGGHGFYINNGTSLNMSACYGLNNGQAGYCLTSVVYSSLNGCATDSCGIGYLLDTCQGVALNGCGCESTVNKSTSYPGHAFKVIAGASNGLYNCWNYANMAIAYWVTGSARSVILSGVSESGPVVGATASIQVDSGSSAMLSGYQVVTALSIAGSVSYWDGVNNRMGISIAPTHVFDAAGTGNTVIGQFTTNTNSGTNTQPVVRATGSDVGNRAFGAILGADTTNRWVVNMDGKQEWGAGNASRDTFLRRSSAGVLATDNTFATVTGLQVGSVTTDFGGGAGVVSIKDATTIPTTNPSGGTIMYSESGGGAALKARDPNGNIYGLTPLFLRKTADTGITSSTTLASDPHLTTNLQANAVYRFELQLFCDGDAAGDLKLDFTVPASATCKWSPLAFGSSFAGGAGANSSSAKLAFETAGTPDTFGMAAVGTKLGLLIRGIVRTSASSGTFALQWAQGTSSANATTIYTDSYMELRRVA